MNEEKFKVEIRRLMILVFCLIAFSFVLFGGLLNIKVLATNGGNMPVKLPEGKILADNNGAFVYSRDSEVNYADLTDKYSIGKFVYSVGDFIIYAGLIILIISLVHGIYIEIKWWKYKQKNKLKK